MVSYTLAQPRITQYFSPCNLVVSGLETDVTKLVFVHRFRVHPRLPTPGSHPNCSAGTCLPAPRSPGNYNASRHGNLPAIATHTGIEPCPMYLRWQAGGGQASGNGGQGSGLPSRLPTPARQTASMPACVAMAGRSFVNLARRPVQISVNPEPLNH